MIENLTLAEIVKTKPEAAKLMEKYDPAKVVFTEKEWSEAKINTRSVMLAPRFGGFTENVSSLVFPEEGYQEATLQELFPKEYK